MVIVDGKGRIVLANGLAERLFGYPHDELLGRPAEDLVPAALRERHAQDRLRYAADPHVRRMGPDSSSAVNAAMAASSRSRSP